MIKLLPTFGCFMTLKKDCVISFDGLYPSSLENVFRISLIININQDTLMKTDDVSWINIENKSIDGSDTEIIKLISSLVEEYNIILHTDNPEILHKLILNDLFGFGYESVGLSSNTNKNTEELFYFVQSIRDEIETKAINEKNKFINHFLKLERL